MVYVCRARSVEVSALAGVEAYGSFSAMLRISIGIPAYNQGRYLRETLATLVAQVDAATEIVVSENHSTDDTASVLGEFAGRVRVVRPPTHLPMMAHWNFLVRELEGEWFALLSSDDRAKPAYLRTLRRGIARDPAAVLVRAGFDVIDGSGDRIKRQRILTNRAVARPPRTFLEQVAINKTSFAAFAFRRDAYDRLGGFDEAFHLYGDWALWLRASALGTFVYERDVIADYRVNHRPGQLDARIRLELEDEMGICLRVEPEVAASLGAHAVLARRAVAAASRHRFDVRLDQISRSIGAGRWGELADLLRPWAATVGGERQLDRLRAGEAVLRRDPGGVLRSRLRELLGRLLD
jgi:glycosyltransferase involved in cell wall biosynthesis